MKAIIIFILLLISGQLIAQNTLSLQGCLEKAVSNNPTFKRGFLDAELAHTNTLAAKAQKLPQTQLQFAQGMNFGRSIDRFSNSYINQLYNSSYGNLQVAMPIYKGFQRQYLTESAQILEQAQEQNIASEKNKLTLLLLKAY
jgi:outer membrane protein